MRPVSEMFLDHFSGLEDTRELGTVWHPVPEILLVTWCGVIAGAEGWEDMEDYGASKLAWLREMLPVAEGIPSDETLRRFFRAVNPEAFRASFVAFVRNLLPETADRLIAIDGKTLRRSHDGATQALHLVSACATEARLVLAQTATSGKRNEITALPALLRRLDLRGATVSIDAMGCQRDIARQIVEAEGASLLGRKGHQGTLDEDVKTCVTVPAGKAYPLLTYEAHDKDHGRIEGRRCDVTEASAWLQEQPDWPGLRSIARITATRILGGGATTDVRDDLTSLPPDPTRLLEQTRSHGAMGNTLHWTRDMSFGEDQCRIRKANAPLALAIIRPGALNLLQTARQPQESIKR